MYSDGIFLSRCSNVVTKCGQHIIRVDGDATRSGGKLPTGEYGEYPTSVLDPHRSKKTFFGLDKQRWAQNDEMACTSRDGESTREEEDASATKTKTIPEQVLGPEWEDRHMLTQRSLEGARAYCAAECERRNARNLPKETSKENLQKGAVCNAFTITLSGDSVEDDVRARCQFCVSDELRVVLHVNRNVLRAPRTFVRTSHEGSDVRGYASAVRSFWAPAWGLLQEKYGREDGGPRGGERSPNREIGDIEDFATTLTTVRAQARWALAKDAEDRAGLLEMANLMFDFRQAAFQGRHARVLDIRYHEVQYMTLPEAAHQMLLAIHTLEGRRRGSFGSDLDEANLQGGLEIGRLPLSRKVLLYPGMQPPMYLQEGFRVVWEVLTDEEKACTQVDMCGGEGFSGDESKLFPGGEDTDEYETSNATRRPSRDERDEKENNPRGPACVVRPVDEVFSPDLTAVGTCYATFYDPLHDFKSSRPVFAFKALKSESGGPEPFDLPDDGEDLPAADKTKWSANYMWKEGLPPIKRGRCQRRTGEEMPLDL
eukprot:g13623.t1